MNSTVIVSSGKKMWSWILHVIMILVIMMASTLAGTALAVSSLSKVLHADTELIATVEGAAVCFPPAADKFLFVLDAENTAGNTPTLDVKVQQSDGVGAWHDLESFTQVTTSASSQIKNVNSSTTNVMKCLRAKLTIGGTENPSYNVKVTAYYRIDN